MGIATNINAASTSRWQPPVPLILLLPPILILLVVNIAKVHHPMAMVVMGSSTAGIEGGIRRNDVINNNINAKPCGKSGCQQLNKAVVLEPQKEEEEEDAATTMGAVMNAEEEMTLMESETSRRLLGMHLKKKYISYEVLRAEAVPCTRPGVPYYNCHAPPRFNAYHRACGIITRCARYDYP